MRVGGVPLCGALLVACAACSLVSLEGLSGGAPDPPGAEGGTDARAEPGDAAREGADADAAPDAPVTPPDASDDLYMRAVMTDAPIGWWRLEEASGTTAKDSSGAGHDAIIQGAGGVGYGVAGALASGGKAFELDGTVDLVLGDLFDFPSPATFTIEAWVKPAIYDNFIRRVFQKMTFTAGPPSTGSYLYFEGSGSTIGFERWVSGNVQETGNSKRPMLATRFTHLVVVHDGTRPRLYVDGALATTGTNNGVPMPDTTTPASWGHEWIGALDELAIYDVPLPAARVLAHYQAAAQP